jgi:8-oxo-dGTP pyrophosphatase MutT (NUDIX family)
MQIDWPAITEQLAHRLQRPLPGASAHEALRALPSGKLKPNFTHQLPPRPGSVLILLYPEAGTIKIPLIKRPDYEGLHSGQVSFPGGKAEPGEDAITTALREAEEEIGVDRTQVRLIGRLSKFFVIPSNFLVTPVLAFCDAMPTLTPDPIEVSRILTADMASLMADDAVRQKEIVAAGRFTLLAPHFEIEGEVVWGATAMMLNELRVVLRELT